MVANVSVNIMEFNVRGESKQFIQLGTVMTDKNERNKGLCRALMEMVLKEWEEKSELIYLFANDSVLDFYPRLGFVRQEEYEHWKPVLQQVKGGEVKKLDLSLDSDQKLLCDVVARSRCHSSLCMKNNLPLIMFYCTSLYRDNIFYLPDLHAIAVAQQQRDTLYLQDIFSEDEIPVDLAINALATEKTEKVVLGFTPLDASAFETEPVREHDTLFIKAKNGGSPISSKMRFPVLSHT